MKILILACSSGDIMSFKDFLVYLWWPFCLMELSCMGNFGRGVMKKHFCENTLNLGQWCTRRCCLKKKFTDNRKARIDTGQRLITKGHH